MMRHGGVAVIIPTVPGREADLARTTAAYEAELDARVYPQYGHATVGAGWTAGVEALLAAPDHERAALPRYVQLGNDDMPPDPGWFDPAVEAMEAGFTPCPVMCRSDGSIESAGSWEPNPEPADWTIVEWTPLPFFRLDEWTTIGPLPPYHYWIDNWFSAASIYLAHRDLVVRSAYRFTHTWAMPGRKSLHDAEAHAARKAYEVFLRECKRGHRG
jgi:hypothetical protein